MYCAEPTHTTPGFGEEEGPIAPFPEQAPPAAVVAANCSDNGVDPDAEGDPSSPPPAPTSSSVVSAVTRTCSMAAVTASQCLGEAQRRAADMITATIGYIARPLGAAWTSFHRAPLNLDELRGSDEPHVAVLGRVYDLREQEDLFLEDCGTRILFTYRKGFPPIRRHPGSPPSDVPSPNPLLPTEEEGIDSNAPPAAAQSLPFLRRVLCENASGDLVSDAGWGCMIRATQMAVCQALVSLRLGRDWRRCGAPDDELSQILGLFRDTVDTPLSIHTITQYASKFFGIPPGHWMGATSCAQVVVSIMSSAPFQETFFFDVVPIVSPDGLIVHSKARDDIWGVDSQQEGSETLESPTTKKRAALLIVCMRLGTVRFNAERYAKPVARCFRLKQFQGMTGGGSWVSAHYFFGECGQGLLFLDPHVLVQDAAMGPPDSGSACPPEGDEKCRPMDTPAERSSSLDAYFLPNRVPCVTQWTSVNPTLALYFLCHDRNDYEELMRDLSQISADVPDLFEMIDAPRIFGSGRRFCPLPRTKNATALFRG